ncbi:MAG: hypothetical protein HQL32_12805, partial [Planctomycetes bacterium]|nr:hypothetical protein [Planctomycetota bacterium]
MEAQEENTYDLEGRMRLLGKRMRKVQCTQALLISIPLTLGLITCACALDYCTSLDYEQRQWLSSLTYALCLLSFLYLYARAKFKRYDLVDIAWAVEKHTPQLDERLISSVEFKSMKDNTFSEEMIERVLEDTEVDLYGIQAKRAFPLRWTWFVLPLAMLLIIGTVMFLPQSPLSTLMTRVLYPDPLDAKPGAYGLEIISPTKFSFAEGSEVTVTVSSNKANLKGVTLWVQGQRIRPKLMEYHRDEGLFSAHLSNIRENIVLWAEHDKVQSEKLKLQIIPMP